MILEKINGMTVLYAEGDNKITNKNRNLPDGLHRLFSMSAII